MGDCVDRWMGKGTSRYDGGFVEMIMMIHPLATNMPFPFRLVEIIRYVSLQYIRSTPYRMNVRLANSPVLRHSSPRSSPREAQVLGPEDFTCQ